MLRASQIFKSFGDNPVLSGIDLTLNRGDRIGLVGPNGCGKTTLLRILVGQERPDSGSVHLGVPRSRLGYLPQALLYDDNATIRDIIAGEQFLTEEDLARRVECLAAEMAIASGRRLADLEQQYAADLERLSQGAYLPDHVIHRVLAGLGLADIDTDTPVRWLSGGQKTRLGLARLLLNQPLILLLDEPTNHLDIDALEWLEEYLQKFDGGLLVVSHDRTFLDATVTSILELDAHKHTAKMWPGNYSEYVRAKEAEEEKYRRAYQEQQERIAKLEAAADALRDKARRVERQTINDHYRRIAKKVAHEGVVRAKRIERLLESEEYLEKPRLHYEMKLEFLETPSSGQDVVILEGVAKRFGERELFRDVNLVLGRGERIALLGPNGCGKTTLLRMIVGEEDASEGAVRLGANVRMGYLSQEQELLDPEQTPLEFVRQVAPLSETQARTFLHYYLFAGDDVFVRIGNLSPGERSRLALCGLVLGGCNLLLLDEPINHLDLASRERFERALATYEGTVLAVVHDRYFVQRFASGLWGFRQGTIRRYVDLGDMRRDRNARPGY